MASIGKINQLQVLEKSPYGYYLDGEELGKILLPNKLASKDVQIGKQVKVFIYADSDETLFAKMEEPLAVADEFAFLKVVSVSNVGAFLDVGLSKDLLVRNKDQRIPMKQGEFYVVFVYLEPHGVRLAASSKLDRFFKPDISHYEEAEEVDLLIWEETELGYKAVVNHSDLGLLYKNEIFQSLKIGQKIKGYVKRVRDDQKIDLILQKPGYAKPDELSDKIMRKLAQENGFLAIHDKSSAEQISRMFGVSKKKFKNAIGGLYKQRKITINHDGIRLQKDKH